MAGPASETCIVVGQEPRVHYTGYMKEYDIGRRKGEYYASFCGIPYAKIPKGKMRACQAPEPLPSQVTRSTSTYDAKVLKKVCTQNDPSKRPSAKFMGSSDCLYLNIFVPQRPELIEELLPVLVFIHGGGFSSGSNRPDVFTPDSIIQHGVVFVTINYRLGAFGFLNMRTKDCPGNAGLKDQARALEWIRDNISCFKGDPNNVTLSGHSAGATCVNLHLISPMSKDLFHKAIVQAGGVFTPWGFKGHQIEQTRFLTQDATFRRLFSRSVESYAFHEHVDHLIGSYRSKRHPQLLAPYFGPTVEKLREGAFMPDNLEEMMKNVHKLDKPIMAGITKAEGIVPFITGRGAEYLKWINNDEKFLQLLMNNFHWTQEKARKLINVIRNRYFPERFTSSEDEKQTHYANLERDISFRRFYDNFRFGPEKTVHPDLYVYRFDHFSDICQANYFGGHSFTEPTHGDELNYLFCPKDHKRIYASLIYEGPEQNKEIEAVMNHTCSLWANFCKTGKPKSDFDTTNIQWSCHTAENPCYLSISANLVLKDGPLFKDEWKWMNELVDLYPPDVHSLPPSPQ